MAKTLTEAQLLCLSSLARNEVFMQLRTLGKASVAEIARALGRKPEAVHYHVRALLRAGLARLSGERPTGHRPESVFEPVDRSLRLPRAGESPRLDALARKAVAAGLRQTLRGYLRATETGEGNRVHVIRMNVRLRPEDFRAFVQLIEQAVQFADQRRDEDGEKLIWSSVLYPATAR